MPPRKPTQQLTKLLNTKASMDSHKLNQLVMTVTHMMPEYHMSSQSLINKVHIHNEQARATYVATAGLLGAKLLKLAYELGVSYTTEFEYTPNITGSKYYNIRLRLKFAKNWNTCTPSVCIYLLILTLKVVLC
uniref:Uncharacterized protein n=1 Tax=Arundo donax TaxID=35708 RepID=A0A0A9GN70_ARUDO